MVDLAAAYSEMGAQVQAQAIANAIIEVYPQFSVRMWLAMPEYKNRKVAEREFQTLKAAGLPD